MSATFVALGIPVLVGALLRIAPAIGHSAPLLDGGLFTVMVREIESHWALPAAVTYSGVDLPFAYPPLGLYLAAGLSAIGLPTLIVVQWLPVLLATLTVPALYRFAVRLTRSVPVALAAAFAFAVAPRAYEWMIAGGGITRALGLLLALLTLAELVEYLRSTSRRSLVTLGVLAGLTILAHPEAAAFTAAVGLVVAAASRPSRRVGMGLLVSAALALAVASPWLITVISTHGIGPLLAAGGSRTEWYGLAAGWLLSLDFTEIAIADPISLVASVGLVVAVLRGWWLPVAMLLATYLVIPSSLRTFAMIPWALLFGVGLAEFVWPRLGRRARMVAAAVGASLAIIGSAWSAYLPSSPIAGLAPDDQAALAWVDSHVAAGAEIAVVTPAHWAMDYLGEWLPALTRAQSVATVQGQEWLGRDAWERAIERHDALTYCHLRGSACLDQWIDEYAPQTEYVYVPKTSQRNYWGADCCIDMRESLARSGGYELVYDGSGAVVYRVEPASGS